jgi:pimeloyl-ACP methyl ester carboxylesterase
MRSLQLDDAVRLAFVDQGAGAPLVLLHGFPLDHGMWSRTWAALPEGWRAIAPDLRGFGASPAVSHLTGMDALADDVAGLLDALPVREPVVLVGLSMGGYVAWQFWRRHADRLRALVLCDTRAVADSPQAQAARRQLAEEILGHGTERAAEAMLPKLLAPQTYAEQPEVVEAVRQTVLGNNPRGLAAALRGMAMRPDMTAELARIDRPALLVVGQEDLISTVDEMGAIAAAMPRARLVVIPGAGHLPPLEQPERFRAALEGFLAELLPGSGPAPR